MALSLALRQLEEIWDQVLQEGQKAWRKEQGGPFEMGVPALDEVIASAHTLCRRMVVYAKHKVNHPRIPCSTHRSPTKEQTNKKTERQLEENQESFLILHLEEISAQNEAYRILRALAPRYTTQ